MQKKSIQLGYFEGWLSIFINTLLFGLKFWVGTISGSVAMIADAWHTLSDTLTSVVVVIGFWISGKPADKDHPFGHGRAEAIGAIVIATLLMLVGFNFGVESIKKLKDHQAATFGVVAVIVFLVSVIIKECLAQFSFWAGRKIKSHSLMADAWHHRSDAIASGLIVAGVWFGRAFWWIDGVMGFCISALILYVAYDILRKASSMLLGEEPEPNLRKEVEALVKRIAPAAMEVHHFHIHRYGEHLEVTLHTRLPADLKLSSAHEIGHEIETAIREGLGIEATLHLEPIRSR